MPEETTPKPWETDRKPNTQFVGKKTVHVDGKPKVVPVPNEDVPLELTAGPNDVIELPPAEIQKAGFFHPRSGFLRRAYGSLYKKPSKLGGAEKEENPVIPDAITNFIEAGNANGGNE